MKTNYYNVFKIKIFKLSKKNKLTRIMNKLNKKFQLYDMKIVFRDKIYLSVMRKMDKKRFLMI